MSVKDLKEFKFQNNYKQIGFTDKKKLLLIEKSLAFFATNLTKQIPDPTKAKEHYELFFNKQR